MNAAARTHGTRERLRSAAAPLRRVLQLAALRFRSEEFKELEIVLLRQEVAVLRREVGRPELGHVDRPRLVIGEATAKTHVARILQKLGLHDRVQAVIHAYATRLVASGSTA